MKVLAITQARSGSTRLPNKVLKEILGKTLLEIHIERIKLSKNINEICIATTINYEDDVIENLAKEFKVNFFRGDENDVLNRFYKAAIKFNPDYIVRLTSDCPLIDPILIDEIISEAIQRKLDYYTNVFEERYPDGQDVEIFTFNALQKAWKEAKLKSDREHVTPYIRKNSSFLKGKLFTSDNHKLQVNYSNVRLTVDEQDDLEAIKILIEDLGFDKGWKTYADHYLSDNKIRSINGSIIRNEGYKKSLFED